MNDTSTAPPGWYPDPSGERQWRVWNGASWSEVTRPYRPAPVGAPVGAPVELGPRELSALATLRHLAHFGLLAYYAGFALLVSVIAHWPGRARPESPRFASAALGVGVGLTLLGVISFAATVRVLRGRWTWDALIPVLNTFATSWWLSKRLGVPSPGFRLGADMFITLGFVVLCASELWAGAFLAVVAFTQLARTYVLLDQWSGVERGVESATPGAS